MNNDLFKKADEDARKAMEENGIVFHEIDAQPFKEASKAYYENMPGLSDGVYDAIMADLEKIRAGK